MLTAEGVGFIIVGQTDRFTDKTLIICFRQVSRYLAGTLTRLQLLGEELLSSAEGLGVLRFLLVSHEVKVRIALLLDSCTFKGTVYLADQQIGRTTIEYQMMNINQ